MSRDEAHRFGQPQASLAERVDAVSSTLHLTQGMGVQRWVGGTHPRMLDIAGGADGWNGWGLGADRLAALAEQVTSPRGLITISWGGSVVMGRDRSDLDDVLSERGGRGGTITGTVASVVSDLRRFVSVGVTHLVVSVLPNRRERWEAFAEAVRGNLG